MKLGQGLGDLAIPGCETGDGASLKLGQGSGGLSHSDAKPGTGLTWNRDGGRAIRLIGLAVGRVMRRGSAQQRSRLRAAGVCRRLRVGRAIKKRWLPKALSADSRGSFSLVSKGEALAPYRKG